MPLENDNNLEREPGVSDRVKVLTMKIILDGSPLDQVKFDEKDEELREQVRAYLEKILYGKKSADERKLREDKKLTEELSKTTALIDDITKSASPMELELSQKEAVDTSPKEFALEGMEHYEDLKNRYDHLQKVLSENLNIEIGFDFLYGLKNAVQDYEAYKNFYCFTELIVRYYKVTCDEIERRKTAYTAKLSKLEDAARKPISDVYDAFEKFFRSYKSFIENNYKIELHVKLEELLKPNQDLGRDLICMGDRNRCLTVHYVIPDLVVRGQAPYYGIRFVLT